jgi:oligopeptide/dipeptide ABC transporter ATP-binding protein
MITIDTVETAVTGISVGTEWSVPSDTTPAHLAISDLVISVTSGGQQVRLVDGFDLELRRGERVALVGESGSGKSVTARAVIRLDPQLEVAGSIRLDGEELLSRSEKEMMLVRRNEVGMVFQDPMGALNPLMTIGAQVAEPLIVAGSSKKDAWRRAREVLDELGVANAAARMKAYPHEFSGGMRQRVVLAIALIGEPKLLIADEPTTALDVRVQEQVLALLDRVSRERGLSVLLITHDLATVAGFAERVAVMYAGRKVHEDNVDAAFREPAHPYTAGLLSAVPRIDRPARRLTTIPGAPPHPAHRPAGCAFEPRCPKRVDACATEVPATQPTAAGGQVACIQYGKA